MDLELSDEQVALRDNVRTVLATLCPPATVRAVFDGATAPVAIWDTMVRLGWPALAIAERQGGLGRDFTDVVLIAEELGRSVVPSPLLTTLTQFVPAIRELGDDPARDRFLSAVASHGRTGTLALGERGRWTAEAVRTSARRAGDAWVLSGEKHAVMDGATADDVVVIARGDAGLGAFVVPREDFVVTPRAVLDVTLPVADLRLADVVVAQDRVLAEPGRNGIEQSLANAVDEAIVALASATTGTCRAIFEATLAYAKAREQYGRPIGSFQALQHRLADMYLAVERATALCYFAALTIAEESADRATASAAAKVGAGDCQRLVVQDGLQLHGGIGYMWEHDLHFFLKRAKAGDALFGDAVAHRARLAHLLGLAPVAAEERAA